MRCLESARLISERRDHPLPLGKQLGLRLHLLLCALCRTYEKQITALCGIAHHAGLEAPPHSHKLPPERKRAIEASLKRD
jgi:hypothetical protein